MRLAMVAALLISLLSCTAHAQTQERLFDRDRMDIYKELVSMLKEDQKFRANNDSFMHHLDAVNAIDDANTRRMIEIIKVYGFPSESRISNINSAQILPHIILCHSPISYLETLRALLNVEKEKGRILDFEYQGILSYLDARSKQE